MEAPVRTLDPVSFEVLKASFNYICDRMRWALQRVSMSPIIYDMVDYSVCIFNPDADLIGQTAGCPIHLGAMSASTKAAVNAFPDGLKEGDAVILNDAYAGGTHVPDVTIVMPMYADDTLMGYATARAHWTDVGGGAAGGQAYGTHIATEGFRMPPMKLMEGGKWNEPLVALIKNQTRMPSYVDGDLMSQIAALRIADEEMKRLVARYGPKMVLTGMQEVLDYTEYVYRQEVEAWPDGEYLGEDYSETDGVSDTQLVIKVKITISGDRLLLDFAGTSPRARGAVNSPIANSMGAVYYGIAGMMLPDVVMNGGSFRVIEVNVPDQCWLNAQWPDPVIACTTHTSSKITAAIYKALSKARPERAIGNTYSECNWFVASVRDPETGVPVVLSELPVGGWGGHAKADGIDVTMDPLGMCQNLPAETAELVHPVTWDRFEMRPDSGGPGEHRGGLGMILGFTPLGDMEFGIETSRTILGADGTMGGGRGFVQYVVRRGPDGSICHVVGWDDFDVTCDGACSCEGSWLRPMQANTHFPAGSQCNILTGGGGGWGDPLKREIDAVWKDVQEGYVTVQGAREDYGVVVDPKTLDVGAAATEALRKELATSVAYREHIQGKRTDYVSIL